MAIRDWANKPILASAGKQTNPADNFVMADVGALTVGQWEVRVIAGGSVAAIFDIERRNAANDANVGPVVTCYTAAGQSAEFLLTYDLEAGERLRVLMDGALTGTAAVSLQVEPLV